MSIPFTSDMLALAQEVIEKKCPVTAAALADCVSENVNHPDFRFSKEWVERLEFTLRAWWERLMQAKWTSDGPSSEFTEPSWGYLVPTSLYQTMLYDYQDLTLACDSIFGRKLKSE